MVRHEPPDARRRRRFCSKRPTRVRNGGQDPTSWGHRGCVLRGKNGAHIARQTPETDKKAIHLCQIPFFSGATWATYVDFARQIKEAVLDIAEIFGSVVLLGGWNDDASPVDYIQSMAKMATYIRTDPFAAYSGTSDGGCLYGKFDAPGKQEAEIHARRNGGRLYLE